MTPKRERPLPSAYASAEAAALAMPPMTDEAIAIVARILAGVERRSAQQVAPQTCADLSIREQTAA